MANTQGFETLIEVQDTVLAQMMRAAWKSGPDHNQPGVIPEFIDIPPGTSIGSLTVAAGHVQLPQEELELAMAPDVNGVALGFGLHVQIVVAAPPIPSLSLISLVAKASARAPVGVLGATHNVGIQFDNLERANVGATLEGAYPITLDPAQFIKEAVDIRYRANGGAFPHVVDLADQVLNVGGTNFLMDVHFEVFNDPSDPAHQIQVSLPVPTTVRLRIPIYLRIHHLRPSVPGGLDPIGVEAWLVADAPLAQSPLAFSVDFGQAAVTTEDVTPASGLEGANYTLMNTASGGQLGALLESQISAQGTPIIQGIGMVGVTLPSAAEIETAIADYFFEVLVQKGSLGFWTPESGGNVLGDVHNIATRALTHVQAIAINASGAANPDAITAFIPAGRSFAVAIDDGRVLAMLDEAIHRPVEEGGLGPDFPPAVIEGDPDIRLRSLNFALQFGFIRTTGQATALGAFLGADVEADYRVDIGLHWEDNDDGRQRIAHTVLDDHVDVHLSPLLVIVAILIGVIIGVLTGGIGGGIIGGIIAVVVLAIADAIADAIGSSAAHDSLGNLGIGAFPEVLLNIGTIKARFQNPIDISPDGMVFAGSLQPVSRYALTAIVPARVLSPVMVAAGTPVALSAMNQHADASYAWHFGDGAVATGADVSHRYQDSGRFVARLDLTVNQDGGALSRYFVPVDVANVSPTVLMGPNRVVDEGEDVSMELGITDPEADDTFEAVWNWGDYQAPTAGQITPGGAAGADHTIHGHHAWGDNGIYTVSLTVRDDDGGIGRGSFLVTVRNVVPKIGDIVHTPPAPWPGQPIQVEVAFSDPGWLDTHTVDIDWDDGHQEAASVTESHEPPEGAGAATATHCYALPGVYHLKIVVTDDDGGASSAEYAIPVELDPAMPGIIDTNIELNFLTWTGALPGTVADAENQWRNGAGAASVWWIYEAKGWLFLFHETPGDTTTYRADRPEDLHENKLALAIPKAEFQRWFWCGIPLHDEHGNFIRVGCHPKYSPPPDGAGELHPWVGERIESSRDHIFAVLKKVFPECA